MVLRDKLLPAAETHRACCRPWLLAAPALLLILTGCERRDQVARYTVEKPPPIESVERVNPHHPGVAPDEPPTGEPTDRTLGAIVPLAPQGWFFKLTGPADAVAAQQAAFTAFLKSVHFAEGKPSWTLPEGWQERPGDQIRFATLVIPSEGKPLELSVTALPSAGGDDENYVLANVNRWRGQLRLPAIAKEQLPDESTQLELDGATATLVNLAGHAAPGTMGRPPFASGAPDGN